MKRLCEPRRFSRIRASIGATLAGLVIALVSGGASADDRFNVCSITINSDDEILTWDQVEAEFERQKKAVGFTIPEYADK